MRKIGMFILTLLSVALLSTPAMVYAECQDGPYDLYINNNKVGTFVDAGMSPDNLPQLNVAASVKKGDKVQFCNASCNEFFFPTEEVTSPSLLIMLLAMWMAAITSGGRNNTEQTNSISVPMATAVALLVVAVRTQSLRAVTTRLPFLHNVPT